jgi:hypothetical protein
MGIVIQSMHIFQNLMDRTEIQKCRSEGWTTLLHNETWNLEMVMTGLLPFLSFVSARTQTIPHLSCRKNFRKNFKLCVMDEKDTLTATMSAMSGVKVRGEQRKVLWP